MSERSVDLQQTAIETDKGSVNYSGDEYVAMLEDLQGNIVKSHGRECSTHLLLEFDTTDVAAVKKWIASVVAPMVTSAMAQQQATAAYHSEGVNGGLFANFALSADGYRALGIAEAEIPDDPSFRKGLKNQARGEFALNDPPVSAWELGFQGTIHALLLLADDNDTVIEAAVKQVEQGLGAVAKVVSSEHGKVLRNSSHEPIEPFGFADGVSQPLFLAPDIEAARRNGGIDRYDPSAPLGLVLLKDPGGGAGSYGSYFVYRKLSQDVNGFKKQEEVLVKALTLEPGDELAGAYAVGRFRDGTPVVAQPVDGWTNEPVNFNYDEDADGMRCPLHAHIRKVNPRGDKVREFGLPAGEDRSRRIARRAVPYPPNEHAAPGEGDPGLLFICAQSSIVHQFEFIQAIWSNYVDFLRAGTGLDTVIGQRQPGKEAIPQKWPKEWGVHHEGTVEFDFSTWVTMRGGEYFFLPSLSFLRGLSSS